MVNSDIVKKPIVSFQCKKKNKKIKKIEIGVTM